MPETRAANKNTDSRVSKYANQSEMSEYPPPVQAYKKETKNPIKEEVTKYVDSEVRKYPQSKDKQRTANKSGKNRGFTSSRDLLPLFFSL